MSGASAAEAMARNAGANGGGGGSAHGALNLYREWGVSHAARAVADSSAALGVIRRKGGGKFGHHRVGMTGRLT